VKPANIYSMPPFLGRVPREAERVGLGLITGRDFGNPGKIASCDTRHRLATVAGISPI
jgi:hypothetical protein